MNTMVQNILKNVFAAQQDQPAAPQPAAVHPDVAYLVYETSPGGMIEYSSIGEVLKSKNVASINALLANLKNSITGKPFGGDNFKWISLYLYAKAPNGKPFVYENILSPSGNKTTQVKITPEGAPITVDVAEKNWNLFDEKGFVNLANPLALFTDKKLAPGDIKSLLSNGEIAGEKKPFNVFQGDFSKYRMLGNVAGAGDSQLLLPDGTPPDIGNKVEPDKILKRHYAGGEPAYKQLLEIVKGEGLTVNSAGQVQMTGQTQQPSLEEQTQKVEQGRFEPAGPEAPVKGDQVPTGAQALKEAAIVRQARAVVATYLERDAIVQMTQLSQGENPPTGTPPKPGMGRNRAQNFTPDVDPEDTRKKIQKKRMEYTTGVPLQQKENDMEKKLERVQKQPDSPAKQQNMERATEQLTGVKVQLNKLDKQIAAKNPGMSNVEHRLQSRIKGMPRMDEPDDGTM